jgi:hypothetical protein
MQRMIYHEGEKVSTLLPGNDLDAHLFDIDSCVRCVSMAHVGSQFSRFEE